jgi:hypothetical protein
MPPTPPTSTPSTSFVKNDAGIRRDHVDPQREPADETDAEDDDDRSGKCGCLAGFLIFLVGCIIG